MTDAHDQPVVNRYVISYPEHEPREKDPHYTDFHAWKTRQRASADTWRCQWAVEMGDDTQCDTTHPLEAHHAHIEFALANSVDLKHLAHIYPGVDEPDEVGAWIESDANLLLLCARHHRAADAGVHHLSASDYEAAKFLQLHVIKHV